ncbi:MAG: hypothetical protein JST69_06490 [Bacteroidetes bacterium]|nr:hypothetical protein [Bacteroidota bacterium]
MSRKYKFGDSGEMYFISFPGHDGSSAASLDWTKHDNPVEAGFVCGTGRRLWVQPCEGFLWKERIDRTESYCLRHKRDACASTGA